MFRSWGGAENVGKVFVKDNSQFPPMGLHPPKWVKPGMLCLCAEHTGDHHYMFVILKKGANGLYPADKAFHGYGHGLDATEIELTKKEYHTLMAGLPIYGKVRSE